MTERALPAVSVGARPLARPGAITRPEGVATPVARPVARPVVRRNEAILTTPARAGMLIGVSAAVYAVSLAGVAGLQAQTDAQVAAARAPYLAAVSQARAANDELERVITNADAETRALANSYGQVGVNMADYQTRLDSLAALVAEVQGSAAALPARIKLPTVTMRGAIAGTRSSSGRSAPATSATSGASGG